MRIRRMRDAVIARHITELSRAAQSAALRSQERSDPVTWIEANRWIGGAPFRFDSTGPKIELGDNDKPADKMPRPYLAEILRDRSETRVVQKSRQSELTENHINEALYYCLTRPHTAWAHIFPTDGLGDDISNEKIEPAILGSPKIAAELAKAATRRYVFKVGSIYTIAGAYKRSGGRARSMDGITYDEFDLMPESVIGVFDAQMEHSAMRLRRFISTPTVPLVGIDKKYREGSQAEWHWTCARCKKEQLFSWPDSCIGFFEVPHYEPENVAYQKRLAKVFWGCKHCAAYCDRASEFYVKSGRWIHARENLRGVISSYSQVVPMIPWKTGREILRRFHELGAYVHQWYNEIWGAAFLKADNRIKREDVEACIGSYAPITAISPTLGHISMGVDWGEAQSWVVISASGANPRWPDRRCVIYMEEINTQTLKENGYSGQTTDHVYRVRQLAEWFQCHIVVNDANGLGTDRNQYLINHLPGRAWGAFFDTAEIGRQLRHSKFQVPLWNEKSRRVTFSKVYVLKELQNEFRRRFLMIPAVTGRYAGAVEKFIQHQQALAVQPRFDAIYQREVEVVVKVNAADHFCDAHSYSKIGWDRLAGAQGSTLGVAAPHVISRG